MAKGIIEQEPKAELAQGYDRWDSRNLRQFARNTAGIIRQVSPQLFFSCLLLESHPFFPIRYVAVFAIRVSIER